MDRSFNFRYVPLAWYNNGYGYGYAHPELMSSIHLPLPLNIPKRKKTPPPPYSELPQAELSLSKSPLSDTKDTEKHVTYTTVQPSLSQLNTVHPSPPASPRSISSGSISSEREFPPSPRSNAGSSRSSSSSTRSFSADSNSSCFADHTLRRSQRRARGMSLRELRLKESEADLKKVYNSTVDSYLSGEIFDNFRSWPEPVIAEEG